VSDKNSTIQQYELLYDIYDHLNEKFFDKEHRLGDCIIIINRKTKEPGHFKPNQWGEDGNMPEISLNPDLLGRSSLRWCIELAHNMIHYWQHKYGNSSRKGYHNTEHAEISDNVGMDILSADGSKDKKTGQIITYAANPKGLLMKEYKYLDGNMNISSKLLTMFSEKKIKKQSVKPTKYACSCNHGFNGKSGMEYVCKECGQDVLPKGSSKAASKYNY